MQTLLKLIGAYPNSIQFNSTWSLQSLSILASIYWSLVNLCALKVFAQVLEGLTGEGLHAILWALLAAVASTVHHGRPNGTRAAFRSCHGTCYHHTMMLGRCSLCWKIQIVKIGQGIVVGMNLLLPLVDIAISKGMVKTSPPMRTFLLVG